MGYNIYIGNATPWHEIDDDLRAGWKVDLVQLPEAPAFGDPSDHRNCRFPSYGAWADSMKALGLQDLFCDRPGSMFEEHPGCQLLHTHHLLAISAAIQKRIATNGGKPPGFFDDAEVDNGKDPDLARGLWLEWWVRWAIENCETPAIQNS